MKETVELLAQYNEHANSMLYSILAKQPQDMLEKDHHSYYRSILGLLNHIIVSDLFWLNRLRSSYPELGSLATPALDFERPEKGKLLYADLGQLSTRRAEVDKVYRKLAAELNDDWLRKSFVFKNPRGEESTRIHWHLLLHLFNHATHHRGQVSQILDENGVEHDFSGISQMLAAGKAH